MLDYIDNSIKPGDDFFKYATGKWLDKNPQPKEYPVWQTFTKLSDDNIHRIYDIIINPDDSVLSKKINNYYKLLINAEQRNKLGNKPVLDYINNHIKPLKNNKEVYEFMAKMHMPMLFSIFISIDDKHNDTYILRSWQGGLSLGNKDYYISKTPDNKKICNAFKTYVISVFKYFGISASEAIARYNFIWKLENKIAKVSYSIEEEQEPSLNYHIYTVEELSKILKFDIKHYLNVYGYDNTDIINVSQIEPLQKAIKILKKLTLPELRWLLEYDIMTSSMTMLDDEAYDIYFNFSKVFSGATEKKPLWKRAVNTINSICDEPIGQLYIQRYFNKDSKEDVLNLVHSLIKSYYNIIEEQTWLSNETKQLALKKLNNMRVKIGYPDKFLDYTEIPIDSNLSIFENSINLEPFFFNINKELHYNKPVDPDEWGMSPQTVNAYFSPPMNEIVFPAAILQPPFYGINATIQENFGAIGAVIGHEMTHGFDNHGRQYNINGQYEEWWTDKDIEEFNKLTNITKEHFNNIEVLPGLKCNGSLTLGENLADYGGVKIAYNALQTYIHEKCIDSRAAKKMVQEFFISYAVTWAGINTEESIKQKTLNNEHSVNYIRVNGTLQMFTPWYEAFDITEKDALYIAPESRAKIW